MLLYLVQSSISLVMFYIIFRFAFSAMTFHHWNRLFLIGAVILSLLRPWTNDWIGGLWIDTHYVSWSYITEEVVIYASGQNEKVLSEGQSTFPWFWIIYITG